MTKPHRGSEEAREACCDVLLLVLLFDKFDDAIAQIRIKLILLLQWRVPYHVGTQQPHIQTISGISLFHVFTVMACSSLWVSDR